MIKYIRTHSFEELPSFAGYKSTFYTQEYTPRSSNNFKTLSAENALVTHDHVPSENYHHFREFKIITTLGKQL